MSESTPSASASAVIGEDLVPALPPVAAAAADAAEPGAREIQGISTSKLLAPIQQETPKLGRKNGVSNLTASQKLDILRQLDADGGDTGNEAAAKATITQLAAQFNISRQSIYRWKKELPQLVEQAKEQQASAGGAVDASAAAASSSSRKRGHAETLIDAPEHLQDTTADGAQGLGKKPAGEEYTAQQKLAMVRQLKDSSKGGNKLRVRQFASKHGVNYRTLYRWIKSEDRLIELVEGEGMGNFKRTKFDGGLERIKVALKVFIAHITKDEGAAVEVPGKTEGEEEGDGGEEEKKQKITGRIVAEKAKQIKDEMLAQHQIEPFLSADEVKAMNEFTGSQSWGRKMCRRYGWGNSSDKAGKKKANDADASSGDDDDDVDHDEGGSSIDMAETDDPNKMKLQIKKLKSDISFLKTKSGKFEKKVAKLEKEKKSLRKQVDALKSKDASQENDAGKDASHENDAVSV